MAFIPQINLRVFCLRFYKKRFEGVLAGGIAGFIGALFFVTPLEAFLASFIAIIAEGIEWNIDDNVVVPFIAACIIWILRAL